MQVNGELKLIFVGIENLFALKVLGMIGSSEFNLPHTSFFYQVLPDQCSDIFHEDEEKIGVKESHLILIGRHSDLWHIQYEKQTPVR